MSSMKKSRIVFILLFCALLAVAAVAVINRANQKPPEVDITANGFSQQNITIMEGDTIHFVNSSSGITQTLCLGQDQVCSSAFDPPELKSPGLRIAPGQSKDVVFTLEGTYDVTSTTAPGMNLTVTVQANA